MLATAAPAIPLAWLARAGLGEDGVSHVSLERGKIVATIERVFAGKVLSKREGSPTGGAAREAIATLFLRGTLFKEAAKLTRERPVSNALAAKILEREGRPVPRELVRAASVEAWVKEKIAALGVEYADDLALLSASDLTAPELPWELGQTMAKEYPATVSVGDASYAATINGGFGMLLDGTADAERKLKNMLYFDVNNGIARRAWARNEGALTTIEKELSESLVVTIPYQADDKLLDKLF